MKALLQSLSKELPLLVSLLDFAFNISSHFAHLRVLRCFRKGDCLWNALKRSCSIFSNCVKKLSVRTVTIVLRVSWIVIRTRGGHQLRVALVVIPCTAGHKYYQRSPAGCVLILFVSGNQRESDAIFPLYLYWPFRSGEKFERRWRPCVVACVCIHLLLLMRLVIRDYS